jgi:hypothetical protein
MAAYRPFTLCWFPLHPGQEFCVEPEVCISNDCLRYIPVFIKDMEPSEFDPEKVPEFSGREVAIGALLGYQDGSSYLPIESERSFLRQLLTDMATAYWEGSVDKMVFSLSILLRECFGPHSCRSALQTAQDLLPDGEWAWVNYLMVTWDAANESSGEERKSLLEEIVKGFHTIDLTKQQPRCRELLSFQYCASLIFLGRADTEEDSDWFRHAEGNVSDLKLRGMLDTLKEEMRGSESKQG